MTNPLEYQKSVEHLFYLINQDFISPSEKIRLLRLQQRILMEWRGVMGG